ncbi:MAG: hypothetical protein IJJ68_03335 [Prevotella sp.]|nr:hypothetical protein [Prevotella sp.]
MKRLMRTTFIALLTALMLVGGSSMGYAQKKTAKQQKSLVTQSMAYKIANLALNNQGRIRYIFCEANGLNDMRTTKTILYSIDEHPSYIENFIVAIFNIYGTGDGGFLAFDDIGFTPAEYDIAEKIYNDIQAKKKEKAIKLEQILYDEYVNNGFPSNIKKESNYNAAKFTLKIKSLAKYINDLGFRESCINTTYDVVVDKDGVMRISPNDELSAATELSMKSAPMVVFENLEKSLFVSSKYKLAIVEKKEKALSDKVIKINWNKNKQEWDLDNHFEFRSEVGADIYRDVTGDLLYTLNNLPELKDAKKKKHTISVTAYINDVVRCYLDSEEMGVKLLRPYIFVKIIK